ncbi:class I SAM-dependent methyltransferase [[Clostridium] fimetarium]|uniref:Methyltransferase domain-containing protein n=1 Tax=[Clostridium] fimetarium TaxID=99656 RepID=A0A1I0QXZ3_9FIRM|nr:class I SAM-dependent methyltransferase [[Clostridium] fimetarium]SEW31919.1 Methyltransferase domain-containing protein [[Clostridium] fimetarium]
MNYEMQPWELLQKKMIWNQLSFIHNKKVLDFGSGYGISANHFAVNNEVVAIEPNEEMIAGHIIENQYVQLKGSIDKLKEIESDFFDIILCHNVLEYVDERIEILNEFGRILKARGTLSVVKHNRNGRVMQMVVLLNNFEHANDLLNSKNGYAKDFGTINYYEDEDITKLCNAFKIKGIYGIRTFWHLQQNQEIHKEKEWQEKMFDIETKVSQLDDFKSVAMFHHIILQKN